MFGNKKKENYFRNFARVGLSAKGLVYCLLSVLAVTTALGLSKRKGNKEEAFKMIHEQPFGQVILAIVGVSLLGFVMLRFLQAIRDTDNKGNDMKGILRRLGLAGSGLIYLGISIYAFKMAVSGASDGNSKQHIISKTFEYPGGHAIIAIIGAFVVGQGLYQIYRGVTARFMKKVQLHHSNFSGTFKKVGIIGHAARGIVLCLIGFLFLRTAYDSNPKEAEGTEGAFKFLQHSGGNWLLILVATGLFAYGVFMFVRARHEKINF